MQPEPSLDHLLWLNGDRVNCRSPGWGWRTKPKDCAGDPHRLPRVRAQSLTTQLPLLPLPHNSTTVTLYTRHWLLFIFSCKYTVLKYWPKKKIPNLTIKSSEMYFRLIHMPIFSNKCSHIVSIFLPVYVLVRVCQSIALLLFI